MPTTSNVFCPNCGVWMKNEKSGVTVEESTGDGRPYKLWNADLYACADCGKEVVVNFASSPISEHFQEEYPSARIHILQNSPHYFYPEKDLRLTHES